jgi:hypothetical protein
MLPEKCFSYTLRKVFPLFGACSPVSDACIVKYRTWQARPGRPAWYWWLRGTLAVAAGNLAVIEPISRAIAFACFPGQLP